MRPALMGAYAWTPADVSGVTFWLDGAYLPNIYQTNASTTPVVSSGDAIGRIMPRTGSFAGAWDQATAGSRHTWSASGINGMGSVSCVGGNSDDVLRRAASDPFDTDAQGLFFAVIKPTSVAATTSIFSSADEAAAVIHFAINVTSGGLLTLRIADGVVSDTLNSTNALAVNTPYVVEVGSTGAAWKMFINGVAETLDETGTPGDWFSAMAAGRDNLTLGARQNTSINQEFVGYIGQLLYIGGTYPAAADQLKIRQYLAGQYGITVGTET